MCGFNSALLVDFVGFITVLVHNESCDWLGHDGKGYVVFERTKTKLWLTSIIVYLTYTHKQVFSDMKFFSLVSKKRSQDVIK